MRMPRSKKTACPLDAFWRSEQVQVLCTEAGCSLHRAWPSAFTEPLLPLPECRDSPMNLPAQLDGGAAAAGSGWPAWSATRQRE